MLTKKLKYQQFLNNYSNCPSRDFREIKGDSFRWVNSINSENDFKPLNLIKDPPQRMLDDSDKMCIGYGLSLFDTLQNAHGRYKQLYNKQKRQYLKDMFKSDKGDQIALLNIQHTDGLADNPNSQGHFTFHEYEDATLANKIINRINIFANDGTIINNT